MRRGYFKLKHDPQPFFGYRFTGRKLPERPGITVEETFYPFGDFTGWRYISLWSTSIQRHMIFPVYQIPSKK